MRGKVFLQPGLHFSCYRVEQPLLLRLDRTPPLLGTLGDVQLALLGEPPPYLGAALFPHQPLLLLPEARKAAIQLCDISAGLKMARQP